MTTDGLGPIPQCWVDWAEETNQQRRGFVAAHSQGGCLMPTLPAFVYRVMRGDGRDLLMPPGVDAMIVPDLASNLSLGRRVTYGGKRRRLGQTPALRRAHHPLGHGAATYA